MSRVLLESPVARERVDAAAAWLEARGRGTPLVVVAHGLEAAARIVRRVALARGGTFGWHRTTLGRFAAEIARPSLTDDGLVPAGALSLEALCARVVFARAAARRLGRLAPIGDRPGLPRALARTLGELRLERVSGDAVATVSPELAELLAEYEAALGHAGLADRALVLAAAARAAAQKTRGNAPSHPLVGLPLLLLDVPVGSASAEAFVAALAARAPETLATVPAADARSKAALERALGVRAETPPRAPRKGSLSSLHEHLFGEPPVEERPLEDDVEILSAPGESRECVEIVRRIHRAAEAGIAFDRMAILLRCPLAYRAHLQEALRRGGVPAHFASGTVRPDPAGRAFAALLACVAEGLSAGRFAEYLSLGEVPDAADRGAPPPAKPAGERWVPPDDDAVAALPEAVRDALAPAEPSAETVDAVPPTLDPEAPVAAGTLRAPHRWERLLVDAAVIGGRDRWERRLAGLAEEIALQRADLEDPDDPNAARLDRIAADLAHLRHFALPLLDALAALPKQASWREWIDALGALATRALRSPERVLSVLAELSPMATVGPVGLGEVRQVLSRRLADLVVRPEERAAGRVLVAPVDAARGLSFDLVFVPGLAERVFPPKLVEDPLLPDEERARIAPTLPTLQDQAQDERLALRLAAGASEGRLVLSFPRLDQVNGRPRVPSFYVLEAVRAAEGRLVGFEEVARRASAATDARLAWPAPQHPADAIDDAEYDLALLRGLPEHEEDTQQGRARYLLSANPHLERALRFRARRWLPSWKPADGLVDPSPAARTALAAHALSARSYSPTALQNYATCPYKFLLYAVWKLAPREAPLAIEEMDPLQKGSLVHEVLYELLVRLRADELLPVTPERLEAARERLESVIDVVAARTRERLWPAIPRVWDDEIAAVRADLREWLARAAAEKDGWVPHRFELSFGLKERRPNDPASSDEPAELSCGIRLRGSIDLVERREDGALRVTDYKTGKVRADADVVVGGGEILQPVLYAETLEALFPEARVEGGRLYYCTSTGGFTERYVRLDEEARKSAAKVAKTIGTALDEAFLPAAPAEEACKWCDYRPVCGPYEEVRTKRKHQKRLAPLHELRRLR